MRLPDRRQTPAGRTVLAGVLVALVALAALTAPAAAGYENTITIHVDDDWAEKEDGTPVGDGYVLGENATASIQAALDASHNGDTIVVHDGTYEEQVVVDKDVTLTPQNESGATIRYKPASSTGQPTVKLTDGGSWGGPTLDGFEIVRVAADDRETGDSFAQAVRISADNVTVTDNTVVGEDFDGNQNAGIMVLDDESTDASGEKVTNVDVTGNDISGFAAPLSVAANYGGTVDNVEFSGNDLSGNDVRGVVVGEPAGSVESTFSNYEYAAPGGSGVTWQFKSASAALDYGAASDALVTDDSGDYLVGDEMSIQAAVDDASAGDTVTVAEDGTYAGFTLNKNLTVTAADGVEATIDADEGVGSSGRVIDIRDSGGNADGATVSNLVVDASGQPDYTVGVSVSADDVTVRNVTVLGDANVTGIQTQTGYDGTGTSGVLVTESTVTDANVGISLQSGNDTATANTVTGAQLEGVGLAGVNYDLSGNDVTTAGDAPAVRVYGTVTKEVTVANDLLDANADVGTMAFDANGHTYARDVSIDGTYYHNIQAALDAAQSGDTVHLADGTYDLGSDRLDVETDGVTLEGESKAGVVIDGSDASWPIYVNNQSDITLRNFTVDGYDGSSNSDDTIKAAFVDGLTIENVAVEGSAGNEIDLNNVVNATLRNVDANGDGTGGVGVALSAVQHAVLDDVDTSGNTWGGVGLYDVSDDVKDDGAPDGWTLLENTSDVTVTAESDLSEDISLYSDQEYGGELGALHAPEYDYAVQNPDHRTRGDDFVFYSQTKSDAVSFALGLANNDSSTVQTLAHGDDGVTIESTYIVGSADGDSMSIQTAVDAASDGDTIEVGAGTYTEQVLIEENVTLVGAGEDNTVIQSPSTLTEKFTDARGDNYPVVFVEDASVNIQSLTVDGAGQGDDNVHFYGVVYRNASGTVADATVENVMDSPMSGVQHGVAVAVFNDDGEDRTFTLQDSTLVDYQKNGFIATGENLTARVIDNEVTGAGPTSVNGQNGIQISGSAAGVIEDNTVSGHDHTDTPPVGTADILLYGHSTEETTIVSNNTLTNSEIGVAVAYSSNVEITDNEFGNNLWHVGDYTGQLDTTTIFASNSYDVAAYVANDSTVTGASVLGDVQAAVDSASSGQTVFTSGTVANDVNIATSNVTLQGVGDATVTGTFGFPKANPASASAFPDDVTIRGFTFAGAGDAINANSAGDNLTVVNNEFDGVTNAVIHGGEDTGKDHLKTGWVFAGNDVTCVENGFRLWNTGDVTVVDNHFEDLSGSAVSLVSVDGATVANNEFVNTTKAGVFVEGPFTNAFNTQTKNVSVVQNTFDAAGDAGTQYTQAAVLVGSNLADLGEVDVHRNAFLNTSTFAVYADAGASASGSVDATLNWFDDADGPASDDVNARVTYDPFLTAPPGETEDELQQFGHDLRVPGDGEPYAVGFPADVDATYGELFGDFEGVVYHYDANDEEWEQVDADADVDPLDAVVVVADDPVSVTVDYADATGPTVPGETGLEAGWNFVAAPQQADADVAFAATAGSDITRVVSQYEGAASAPYGWDAEDFGTYTLDASGSIPMSTPNVSPFSGYWVYASDDGSLAGAAYPGLTYSEELATLMGHGGAS